jgi:hypothetical protein
MAVRDPKPFAERSRRYCDLYLKKELYENESALLIEKGNIFT